jgi:hypothetical protein
MNCCLSLYELSIINYPFPVLSVVEFFYIGSIVELALRSEIRSRFRIAGYARWWLERREYHSR